MDANQMTYIVSAEITGYRKSTTQNAACLAIGREEWERIGSEVVYSDNSYPWPKFDNFEAETPATYWSWKGSCTLETVIRLQELGVDVEIGRVRGMSYTNSPHQLLSEAQAGRDKTEIHVHVPGGVALTSVTKVQYMEDACTNALQDELDDGWIIIAVCPANDSRRPTYILGKNGR